MKTSNTSKRLKEYMTLKNLRQVDLLKLAEPFCKKYDVKLNKSDLSQYVSGKVEPGQDKLFVLAKALNVTESWLMGYDDNVNTSTDGEVIYLDIIPDKTFEELTAEEKNKAINNVATYFGNLSNTIYDKFKGIGIFSEEYKNSVLKEISQSLQSFSDTAIDEYADNANVLIHYLNKLNHEGHKEILKRAIELSQIEKYTKKDNN